MKTIRNLLIASLLVGMVPAGTVFAQEEELPEITTSPSMWRMPLLVNARIHFFTIAESLVPAYLQLPKVGSPEPLT